MHFSKLFHYFGATKLYNMMYLFGILLGIQGVLILITVVQNYRLSKQIKEDIKKIKHQNSLPGLTGNVKHLCNRFKHEKN